MLDSSNVARSVLITRGTNKKMQN